MNGREHLTVEAMQSRIEELEATVEAARVLFYKMIAVYASPEYEAVWALWQSHFGPYKGDDWIKEQTALEYALRDLDGAK